MNADERTLILVVDDNDSRRYAKVRLLRQAGYEILEAASGEECVRLLSQRPIKLVVLDIGLPDGDGREFCRRIKADPAMAGVLVLQFSATFVSPADTAQALDEGADASLTEPLQPPILLATVRALLRTRQAEDALRVALEREQIARSEAESANRAKDDFLAVLSHELRSPLNAILTWATLLRQSGRSEEEMAAGLEAIERNARLQTRLIGDLLDVSRIISGKLVLALSEVPLTNVLEASLERVRRDAETKSITMELAIEGGLGNVAGDAGRLEQIVMNLLSNAIKFTPTGGRVALRAQGDPDGVRIEVADNGMGIPADLLPHIFERFRQGDSTNTRSEGGLGLGLAIVRHLVGLHEGKVEALSDGRGRGATFRVSLPRVHRGGALPAARSKRSGPAASPRADALRGVRILLVDDDPDVRQVIRTVLQSYGAEVRTAATAGSGITSLEQNDTDIVVTDLGMPKEDGYSLLERARSLSRAGGGMVAFVALTAYAGAHEESRALSAGFDAFLTKPVEPRDLIVLLTDLAGRQRHLAAPRA